MGQHPAHIAAPSRQRARAIDPGNSHVRPCPTSTTVLDSILFRDAFGTPRMRAVFSDRALIARYVEVEVALARAEARCGVIPAEAAEEIAAKCDAARARFRPAAPRDRQSSAIRSCRSCTSW